MVWFPLPSVEVLVVTGPMTPPKGLLNVSAPANAGVAWPDVTVAVMFTDFPYKILFEFDVIVRLVGYWPYTTIGELVEEEA